MTALTTLDGVSVTLNEHATEIRKLYKRTAHDIHEIGRRLTEAKKLLGHGNWLNWLDAEFGWTDRTALNFMRVYELPLKSETVSDLDISVTALYRLARPSTPVEVCEEVIERAKAGEPIKDNDVKEAVEQAKVDLPAPITASREFSADRYLIKRLAVTSNFEELVERLAGTAGIALLHLQAFKKCQAKLSALTLSGEQAKIAKVIAELDIRAGIKIAEAAEKQSIKLRKAVKADAS
jgi:hypothetical protein